MVSPPQAYHPFAACLMFQQTRSSEATQANLAAVLDYGMKAAAAGITLDQALSDINRVLYRESVVTGLGPEAAEVVRQLQRDSREDSK
jgi:hypothetical protein